MLVYTCVQRLQLRSPSVLPLFQRTEVINLINLSLSEVAWLWYVLGICVDWHCHLDIIYGPSWALLSE